MGFVKLYQSGDVLDKFGNQNWKEDAVAPPPPSARYCIGDKKTKLDIIIYYNWMN